VLVEIVGVGQHFVLIKNGFKHQQFGMNGKMSQNTKPFSWNSIAI